MTNQRWERTGEYLREVFGREDEQLATLMERAVAAGLPSIAVSSEVGRLLKLLTGLTGGGRGAKVAVEVGTLAGFSGIWLARGLAADGRLVTVELEERHATFAQGEFERAGVADRVEIRRGAALDVLPRLARELGPDSVDVAFLDAVKTEYSDYFRVLKPMIRRGGLLLADNVVGSGEWWIDDAPGRDASRDAVDAFNRLVAQDPDFESVAVPVRQGVMVARRL